jgi:hypothetical protein
MDESTDRAGAFATPSVSEPRVVEYMRFTVQEVAEGRADGWTLACGWFPFQQTMWAWFRQTPTHQGDHHGSDPCPDD